jgi:hypothetical protein
MDEKNQSVKSGDSRGAKTQKPPKPKSSKTKSRRIPNELLPLVDNLLLVHKRNSSDGRTTMRNPGLNQKRFSSKSEIREIPLEFLQVVDDTVASWRAQQKSSDK